MYKRDQKVISMLSKNEPTFTREVMVFALTSIRNHTYKLPVYMNEIKKRGSKAKLFNNASRKKGWLYIRQNYKTLHTTIHDTNLTVEEKLAVLTDIPNIGIVKAGFILQMCIGEVGCIDCHNANLYGVDLQKFKLSTTARLATKLRKAKEYTELCEKAGGSEKLWNNWCAFIAEQYPTKFNSKDDVSRLHVDTIVSVV